MQYSVGEHTSTNRNWLDVSLMIGDQLNREPRKRFDCSQPLHVPNLRNKLVPEWGLGTTWAFILDAHSPQINYLLDNRGIDYDKKASVAIRRDLLLAEICYKGDPRYLTAEGGAVAFQMEYNAMEQEDE
ncbi:hypothetical protein SARC_08823 [Sphaeroforma arctica JP610]|uniref:Uncharacterized protein n=1 Tax=Sphaeroforma arctica JP610 TaxID=667725 RepID=A0A0L0FPX1_9EUKA|nr:hypothetical protein SARC_08823 [Sphaeroforma arctica JP610]KNC78759.1 hypothetical protein SARC_08823 [Sphaeroforma arctica JP610]|eukprot:XP_014152661.1 hypothetical protein SARC_08823 [Sphaeroforma arctica JP610]